MSNLKHRILQNLFARRTRLRIRLRRLWCDLFGHEIGRLRQMYLVEYHFCGHCLRLIKVTPEGVRVAMPKGVEIDGGRIYGIED